MEIGYKIIDNLLISTYNKIIVLADSDTTKFIE